MPKAEVMMVITEAGVDSGRVHRECRGLPRGASGKYARRVHEGLQVCTGSTLARIPCLLCGQEGLRVAALARSLPLGVDWVSMGWCPLEVIWYHRDCMCI